MNNKVLDRTDLDTTGAYAQLQRVAQDVLSGVADRAITVACTGRSPVEPADLVAVERDVLIELAFEHPADSHHAVVVLADAATLAALFALDLEEDGVSLAADAVIRLGDIISAFLDTLVGGLTWLQPTPRVWLANIEQLIADTGGGFRCDLPAALAAEPALACVQITLGTDDAGSADLDLLIGPGAEQALFAPTQSPVNGTEARHAGMPAVRAGQQQGQGRQAALVAEQSAVQHVQFAPLETERPARATHGIDLIRDVPLKVSVELGSTTLTVREVLALGAGSVVALDRLAGEPVDVLVNDRLIARGEVVIVDESFGVRVSEIVRENGARGRL